MGENDNKKEETPFCVEFMRGFCKNLTKSRYRAVDNDICAMIHNIVHTNNWWWGTEFTVVANGGLALYHLGIEDGVGYLSGLIVHPSVRNRGIGRKLLADSIARAKKLELSKMVLWAKPDDWPIEWYKRNGFVEKQIDSESGMVLMEKAL